MRDEAGRPLDSVRETIRIGAEAGVPVQISHHKASGQENWGRVRDSLKLIEQARARGQDVTADQYPYTSGSTALAAVLQNDALERTVRAKVVLAASVPRRSFSLPPRIIPNTKAGTSSQLAVILGLDPMSAARRIVEEEGNGAIAVFESMDETDVRTVMSHPTTMIGSDGLAMGSKPHPRLYGCFSASAGPLCA